MGLQPGDDFVANKNTYEKIGLLGKLIHEAGKKAGGGAGKMTNEEWVNKEKAYQKELKDLKEGITKKETEWAGKEEENLTATEIKMLLTGKNYALPKDMAVTRKVKLAYDALKDKLAADGFTLKRSETGKLIIVNKEGQPAYNGNNEEVTPDTYIDAALAGDKLLAINDDNGGEGGNKSEVIPGGGSNQKGNAAIMAEIDADMKDLGLSAKPQA
jgi:hypothetical protein